MNLDEKIKLHIPQDELLAQLVEECAELSQAALKPAFAAWLIMITGQTPCADPF